MATRADITPELCRQLLRYEPETGKLFWKARSAQAFKPCRNRWGGITSAETNALAWNKKYAGTEAFTCVSQNGYLTGRIMDVGFLAHRVCWAIHYGEWPNDCLDHIDGNKRNNRIGNLRDADHQINGANTKKPADNTSGIIGISWCHQTNKWTASIMVGQRSIWLGRHGSIEAAKAARLAAEKRYGFHPNHGR